MRLVEQGHKILFLSPNILKTIEMIGRTCYKSTDQITHTSAEKFVQRLKDKGHHAMLEFGTMTVEFWTNRGVTHELVRHRLCSFAQESTRYCNYGGKDMEFIRPVWLSTASIGQYGYSACFLPKELGIPGKIFVKGLLDSEYQYNQLLVHGWKPQQAREVLPNALKTAIVVQSNLREWMHIFKMRCAPDAHPQMQALMKPLLAEVQTKIPVLFEE